MPEGKKFAYTIGGKWLEDLNREFAGSERGCAVLAAAVLDERLLALLKKYLLPAKSKKDDKLFGASGAANSFSSRIELARRLNLISKNCADALDQIRTIRNIAAHSSNFSFDTDKLKDIVSGIVQLLELQKRLPVLLEPPYDSIRGRFTASTFMLVCVLEIECGEVSQTNNHPVNVIDGLKYSGT